MQFLYILFYVDIYSILVKMFYLPSVHDEIYIYFMDRVSYCNIYAVQQDTHSVLMSEFIHHLC